MKKLLASILALILLFSASASAESVDFMQFTLGKAEEDLLPFMQGFDVSERIYEDPEDHEDAEEEIKDMSTYYTLHAAAKDPDRDIYLYFEDNRLSFASYEYGGSNPLPDEKIIHPDWNANYQDIINNMETANIRFTTFNPGESSFKIYFQEETNGFFTYTYFSYDLQGKPIYVSSTCARNEVQPIGTPPPEYSKAYSELYIYVRKILGEPLEEKRFTINDVSEAPWPWSENENECSVIIWKDAQSVYELTAAFTNDGKQLTMPYLYIYPAESSTDFITEYLGISGD